MLLSEKITSALEIFQRQERKNEKEKEVHFTVEFPLKPPSVWSERCGGYYGQKKDFNR